MARKQHIECVECDAVFKINHDMDSNYYLVEYCPFCGTQLEEEQEEGYEEDEDLS